MMIEEIGNKLAALANPEEARFLQKYFKTGPGQYGEGDIFRGIRVPALRKLSVAAASELSLAQTAQLLESGYHEDRLLALFILVRKSGKAHEELRAEIYELYLASTKFINNWDLVDCSAGHIVGAYLFGKEQAPLDRLAESSSLWERRIAIMATSHYIGKGEFEQTLRIAEKLVHDREDLIHKAVGWMLREVGKRDLAKEEAFLLSHHRTMPRTMLRYAIEKFPGDKRRAYLKGLPLSPP